MGEHRIEIWYNLPEGLTYAGTFLDWITIFRLMAAHTHCEWRIRVDDEAVYLLVTP